jgi:hypothetical protein
VFTCNGIFWAIRLKVIRHTVPTVSVFQRDAVARQYEMDGGNKCERDRKGIRGRAEKKMKTEKEKIG